MTSDLQALLEQALRERDEARASNVALRLAGEELRECVDGGMPHAVREERKHNAIAVLEHPHPGASMLRELQALRRVRDAIGGVLQAPLASVHHSGAVDRLNAACAEADAARTP